MSRRIYNPTTVEIFVNFILLNDGIEFVENPKEWVKFHSKTIKQVHKLRSDDKKGSYKLMVAFLESHKEINVEASGMKNEEMSALAKKKSSQLLDFRIWAVTYYLYRRASSNSGKPAYKKTVAHEIREKLIMFYPELKPKDSNNHAEAGQIPKASTIATEWLKNI